MIRYQITLVSRYYALKNTEVKVLKAATKSDLFRVFTIGKIRTKRKNVDVVIEICVV